MSDSSLFLSSTFYARVLMCACLARVCSSGRLSAHRRESVVESGGEGPRNGHDLRSYRQPGPGHLVAQGLGAGRHDRSATSDTAQRYVPTADVVRHRWFLIGNRFKLVRNFYLPMFYIRYNVPRRLSAESRWLRKFAVTGCVHIGCPKKLDHFKSV